jgi:membrane protein implicated in regulation of membrane protease activity
MNFWIIIFFILIIIEAIIGDFTALSISIGAISSIILAYFNVDVTYQIISCGLVSFLSIFIMKPFLKKNLIPEEKNFTHQSFIGQKAIVVEEIKENDKGKVKINGEIWYAKSYSNIKEKEEVIVQDIDNNFLIVVPKKDLL